MTRPWLAHRRPDERGQVLVLFAIMLVAMILAVGLVIDGGNAFLHRRTAQNVSDLASMAGTKVILDAYVQPSAGLSGADVYAAIGASAAQNDCNAAGATPCTWSAQYVSRTEAVLGTVAPSGAIPVGAQGVRVHVDRVPHTFFLGLIGQGTWQVGTDATALTARLTGAPGGQILPIATNPPNPFEYGQTYNLTDGSNGPGNFGWLSWTGSNASGTLANSICNPDNPGFSFPADFPGEPGKHNSSAVRDCLQKWVDSGAQVLIPIFDSCSPCNGNNASYHIIGLAAFRLTGFTQPAIDEIQGVFDHYYPLPSVPAGYGGPPTPGDKTLFIGLIR
jgi:hypothetical protein